MPTAYTCDTCKKAAQDLEGWFVVSVNFAGGVAVPDLVFDTLVCRQAWCVKAGITDPGQSTLRHLPPSLLRPGPTLPPDVTHAIVAALNGPPKET